MKPKKSIFHRKGVDTCSLSNSTTPPYPLEPTLIEQIEKEIKDMEFIIYISHVKVITKKVIFSTVNNSVYFIMLTLLIPFCFSCTQPDTIAPQTEVHSAAREAASVLNVDGFEDTKLANFWHPELHTATAGLISRGQQRVGKQSMRFSWKPTQVDGTNTMLHSELAISPLAVGDIPERWYGYSSFMPSSSMAKDDQTVIVSQWHGVPDPGFEDSVPPLCIEVKSDQLKLWYAASNVPTIKPLQSPTSSKRMDLGAAIYDRWVDYVVHIKWDPTGTTGVLEIWQDGKQIVNEQGISIGYLQQRKPYWKIGLYCWMGNATYAEKNIYYDEVRIGSATADYNAVKPGRNDNSAKAQQ